jgi:hypothetical protein
LIAGLAVWYVVGGQKGAESLPIPGTGERVTVEVLNGTRMSGLARETTRRLRGAGLDVVYFGDAEEFPVDSTRILIRRGDSIAAQRVRRALGRGQILAAPNSRLLLDITVVLGLDMAPALGLEP